MPDSADLASTWHIRHVESNNSQDTFIYSSYLKLNGFEFYFLALAVHPRRPDKSVLHFDCRHIWCYLNKSTSGEWVLFAYLIINYLLIISFENIFRPNQFTVSPLKWVRTGNMATGLTGLWLVWCPLQVNQIHQTQSRHLWVGKSASQKANEIAGKMGR